MELRIFVEPQQGATYDDQLAVALQGRGARVRRVLPVRPLPRDGRRRSARPDRLVGDARRARARDEHDPARHDDDVGDLPLPRSARDRGRAGRPDERRAGRARHRRRLVRRRARGVRHPVPADRRAVRPARGPARDPHRPVGDARRARPSPTTGTHHSGRRLARAAQAGAAAAPADHHRRQGREADAGPDRALRRRVQPAVRRRSRSSAASRSSACVPRARRSAATRPSLVYSIAHTDLLRRRRGRACSAGPRSIGRPPTTCVRTASPARPTEVVDRSAGTPRWAAQRVYLQVLDLHDLDHLDLLAAEVMPARLTRVRPSSELLGPARRRDPAGRRSARRHAVHGDRLLDDSAPEPVVSEIAVASRRRRRRT